MVASTLPISYKSGVGERPISAIHTVWINVAVYSSHDRKSQMDIVSYEYITVMGEYLLKIQD